MPSDEFPQSSIEKLTNAIQNLDHKVTQLTLRLTGDSSLQTTGLIHDVQETRAKIDLVRESTTDHGHRLDAIENQNHEQAGMLDDLKFLRALTNKTWKVMGILIAGGVLHPLAVAWIQKIFGGK